MSLDERVILLRGGLDLVSPRLAMDPGTLAGALNYEADVGGYRRAYGYERFSGQLKPSEASYWILSFTAAMSAFAANDLVTGGTSGATGIVLAAVYTDGVTAGDFNADFDAGFGGGIPQSGYLVLAEVTGTFADGEDLQILANFSDEFTLEFD